MRFLGLPLLIQSLFLYLVIGCGNSTDNCRPQESTFCHDDATYWVDSCGNIGQKIEDCRAGCLSDHSGCATYECTTDSDCKTDYFCDLAVYECKEKFCTLQCLGKCCGSDGCGGQCPDNCSEFDLCNIATCLCESSCQPNCSNKECGDDDCGDECPPGCSDNEICSADWLCECHMPVCGDVCCLVGEVCHDGACCTPLCDSIECGDDACGGSCGDCDNDSEICQNGTCVAIQFRARVLDFASGGSESIPVPDISVRVLDDALGAELGIETVSGVDGTVIFGDLPLGRVGFLVVGVAGTRVDTYQFNIESLSSDVVLWSVDLGTYQMAPLLAGYVQNPDLGTVFGSTYWTDGLGISAPVGCSTINGKIFSGDIRYFGDNNLPTTTVADDPIYGRDDVNPTNGLWIIGNVDPINAVVNIEGHVDGQGIASIRLFAFPFSVSIGNILYEGLANPQPLDCD